MDGKDQCHKSYRHLSGSEVLCTFAVKSVEVEALPTARGGLAVPVPALRVPALVQSCRRGCLGTSSCCWGMERHQNWLSCISSGPHAGVGYVRFVGDFVLLFFFFL